MHINNPDTLRNWLSSVLEPMCDADPAALARYILALLKKDKPLEELKRSMQEQLDVFLGQETAPFINRLFAVLKSEEYLSYSETTTEKNESKKPLVTDKQLKEFTPPLENVKTKDFDGISLSPCISLTMSASSSVMSPAATDFSKNLKSDDSKDNNKRKRRSKSRSRSLERLKRSKSRDRRRDHSRERSMHKFRNKSPPNSNAIRRRAHLESKRHGTDSDNKSRSMSPDSKKSLRPISPTSVNFAVEERSKKSQRCRDFDEKGYCMRGETCPWDHGVDPVVLEDINNSSLLHLSGPPRPLMPEYNPYVPELWNRGSRSGIGFNRVSLPNFKQVSGNNAYSLANESRLNQVQRELIPITVVTDDADSEPSTSQQIQKRRFDDEYGKETNKRKPPISTRLGARVVSQGQSNCSLELRKVPRGLNAIAHLNNHFSRFGKITNIQVSYDGDPEAAIITFSTHAEANVAYRSTEAVLNNRFIKVFWHSPMTNDTSNSNNKLDMSRNKNQYHINHKINDNVNSSIDDSKNLEKPTGSTNTKLPSLGPKLSSTTPINVVPRLSTPKLKREVAQLARKQKENAVQVACGLTKKKQGLLEGYIKQMSSIVMLLSKSDLTETQKTMYKETIKQLETKIGELKKEISNEQQKLAQVQPQIRKTKEQKQKELLDVELDLITQEHAKEGDSVVIQTKLNELQKTMNVVATKGRGKHLPRGSAMAVDRRPKTIHVAGFDVEDSDILLGHFKHFGEITRSYLEKNVPYLIISFATRLNAEQAMQKGATFKEKLLHLTWITSKESNDEHPNISLTDNKNVNIVLQTEDEDELEKEDRSWRR